MRSPLDVLPGVVALGALSPSSPESFWCHTAKRVLRRRMRYKGASALPTEPLGRPHVRPSGNHGHGPAPRATTPRHLIIAKSDHVVAALHVRTSHTQLHQGHMNQGTTSRLPVDLSAPRLAPISVPFFRPIAMSSDADPERLAHRARQRGPFGLVETRHMPARNAW
jgi:hypothetical protein